MANGILDTIQSVCQIAYQNFHKASAATCIKDLQLCSFIPQLLKRLCHQLMPQINAPQIPIMRPFDVKLVKLCFRSPHGHLFKA